MLKISIPVQPAFCQITVLGIPLDVLYSPLWDSRTCISQNVRRCLFTDHHDRQLDVVSRYLGKHKPIHNPQSLRASHSKLRIQDSDWVVCAASFRSTASVVPPIESKAHSTSCSTVWSFGPGTSSITFVPLFCV